MRDSRFACLVLGSLLALVFFSPAHGSHSVTVTLAVSTHAYPVKDVSCPISLSHGSNGIAVLDAAKAAGCINSYSTVTYPGFGTFVSCIDQRCGDGADKQYLRYWAMRDNCSYTSYGVEGFRADPGDELSFTFEPWPVSSAPMDALCLV